jgi:hypothetical protein
MKRTRRARAPDPEVIDMGAFTEAGAHRMAMFYKKNGWTILSRPQQAADTTWRWTMHRPHGSHAR